MKSVSFRGQVVRLYKETWSLKGMFKDMLRIGWQHIICSIFHSIIQACNDRIKYIFGYLEKGMVRSLIKLLTAIVSSEAYVK